MEKLLKIMSIALIICAILALITNLLYISNVSMAASFGFEPTFWSVLGVIIAIIAGVFEIACGICGITSRKDRRFNRVVGMAAIAAVYELVFAILRGTGMFSAIIGIGIPVTMVVVGRLLAKEEEA